MPTLWFWNDRENQRLLTPIGLLTIPVYVLLNMLQVWLGLDAWLSIVASLGLCFLTQGLMERHIRKQLRLRLRSESSQGLDVPSGAPLPVEPFIGLAGVSAAAAILVSALAWGIGQGLFAALVLALVMVVTVATTVFPARTAMLACAALAYFCASLVVFVSFGLPGLGASLGVLALVVALAVAGHRHRAQCLVSSEKPDVHALLEPEQDAQ